MLAYNFNRLKCRNASKIMQQQRREDRELSPAIHKVAMIQRRRPEQAAHRGCEIKNPNDFREMAKGTMKLRHQL